MLQKHFGGNVTPNGTHGFITIGRNVGEDNT